MTLLFSGELASHCQSSSTVDLDFSPENGVWAFELEDSAEVLRAKVTLGGSIDAPAWVCPNLLPDFFFSSCQDRLCIILNPTVFPLTLRPAAGRWSWGLVPVLQPLSQVTLP